MKKHLSLFVFLLLPTWGQIQSIGGSGGIGIGAPNPYTTVAGASTAQSVTVTSLGLTSIAPAMLGCKTATAPVTFTYTTTGTAPITAVNFTYASTAGVTCTVNATGGIGATGAKGDKGDTGGTPQDVVGVDLTAALTGTITHNYASKDVGVWCRNSSDGQVFAGSATNATTNTIDLTFSPAFTGRCWAQPSVIGSGGGSYTLPTASGSVLGGVKVGTGLSIDGSGILSATGGGSMTYPGAGVARSTGSAWDTSYTVGTSPNNLLQLNGSGQIPAVSAALLTNFPTLNQSTTGNAATATALATARTIMGLSFDGTANIGSRSGNTTEFGTISGTKTTGKQLQFDASGNIAASSTDIGAGSGGSSSPTLIAFAGEPTRTVTAATHGLGTTPVFLGCRRTSDGVWATGVAYTTNSSGDVTINPGGGAAYTGSCYIGGPPSGSLVLVDPNLVPTRISASASLSFSTFSGTGNCEEQNITLTGAASGDVPTVGLPTPFPAGLVASQPYVSTTNTVTIRICRLAGTNTISSQTFTAQIVRGM